MTSNAINLAAVSLSEITDSEGAQARLAARFGHPVSHDRLRQFVKTGQLRSLMFRNGRISFREPSEDTRGKDLLFLLADLDALPIPNKPGRPVQPESKYHGWHNRGEKDEKEI